MRASDAYSHSRCLVSLMRAIRACSLVTWMQHARATSSASRSVSTVNATRAPSGVLAVTQFMYVLAASIRSTARRRTTSAMPIQTAFPSVSSVRSRTTMRWIEGPDQVGPV